MTTAQTTSGNGSGTVRDRIPPQDLDAEMALLGAMMLSRDVIGDIVQIIPKSDSKWLYRPDHQRLFEVLLDVYDEGAKAIDLVVVADELRRRELLDKVGGIEYLVQLAESFADISNAEHYARIVRDKGILRDLIRATHEIADISYSQLEQSADILDVAEQKLLAVTERRVRGHATAVGEHVTHLAELIKQGDNAPRTGISSGFVQLDDYTTGFQPGDLIVLAGRPSMGKTAIGLTIAHHLAFSEKLPVAFFSMEMSSAQLAARLLCAHAHFDQQRLRKRMLSEGDQRRLLDACSEIEHIPLYIDDTPSMSPLELRAKARRVKQQKDVQAIFVDYLQLMHVPKTDGRQENRQVEVAEISRQLKSLGRELGIPIIALAQLNRLTEGRDDKRPRLSDIRESGAIEQDADVVLFIHREEYYKPEDESVKGKAELIIAKQRNGPAGVHVDLTFIKKCSTFGNYSPESATATYAHSADAPF